MQSHSSNPSTVLLSAHNFTQTPGSDTPLSSVETGVYGRLKNYHRLSVTQDEADSSPLHLAAVLSTVKKDDDDRFIRSRTQLSRDERSPVSVDCDMFRSVTLEERERLEWQSMLESVLEGDVFRSEKTRIQGVMDLTFEGANIRQYNLWTGLRSKLRSRSEEEERRMLDERRARVVPSVLAEVMKFKVNDSENSFSPFQQVQAVLHRLDVVHSLYPSLKALCAEKPMATEPYFRIRCEALYSWSTIQASLDQQIALLHRWTGGDTIEVHDSQLSSKHMSDTNARLEYQSQKGDFNLAERILRGESIQRTFEKGLIVTVYGLLASARATQIKYASTFRELNLPAFEEDIFELIRFPTQLASACLRVRLSYAQKVKDPDTLIVDQLLEDFRHIIGLACTVKRQYKDLRLQDSSGNWHPPNCIADDYDSVVLETLMFFFQLINWKLKSVSKDILFKETDILEAHWVTFGDVSFTVDGGAAVVAEQICALTARVIVLVTSTFEQQVRLAGKFKRFHPLISTRPHTIHAREFQDQKGILRSQSKTGLRSDEYLISWYARVLESIKARYRKLQRFSRSLPERFCNAAEYSLDSSALEPFISSLIQQDHFLVYTQSFEEEGMYVVASRPLRDRPEIIRRILQDAFDVSQPWGDGYCIRRSGAGERTVFDENDDDELGPSYLLILSPRSRFLWTGLVLVLPMPRVDLDLKDNRVRLVADGSQVLLTSAKRRFRKLCMPRNQRRDAEVPHVPPLVCVIEQLAHLPTVNRELKKIVRATDRLAEVVIDSVQHVRSALMGVQDCADLLQSWYLSVSEHGQHAQKYMERSSWLKFNRLLIHLAISWVAFICDDCDPTDSKTFRWAVSALEFTMLRTKEGNILHIPDAQFELLRQKVASCMTLLISHYDILGARSILEAKRDRERKEEVLRQQAFNALCTAYDAQSLSIMPPDLKGDPYGSSRSIRAFQDNIIRAVSDLEEKRKVLGSEQHMVGQVLDQEKPEDRSLMFLASSGTNISIRWQQGKFVGAGAFGSVYMAVNLDSGSVMAVKEIRHQDVHGMPRLFHQIQDELRVMEMLHHPNIVEYYGIEVHRDKIYIFEEYCEGGSLAANLEVGRIADEHILQVYTMQMLEGLAYLHSQGIVHRDIKPDSNLRDALPLRNLAYMDFLDILLDRMGVLKFVDFGAAKILAKNTRTIQRSGFGDAAVSADMISMESTNGLNHSLTGTPMYMSPEVIKNDRRGRHGAMDIWSMGCVVLECATGRKPWSNLDNEWAIMFHIGVATQYPPLPDKSELSSTGIAFIQQCLTIDPMQRPTAPELMQHTWMVQFMETLRSYEEEELSSRRLVERNPQSGLQRTSY